MTASPHPNTVTLEDEGFAALDHARNSTGAVGERRRDFETSATSNAHTLYTAIPTRDDLPDTELKAQRLAAIP